MHAFDLSMEWPLRKARELGILVARRESCHWEDTMVNFFTAITL